MSRDYRVANYVEADPNAHAMPVLEVVESPSTFLWRSCRLLNILPHKFGLQVEQYFCDCGALSRISRETVMYTYLPSVSQ